MSPRSSDNEDNSDRENEEESYEERKSSKRQKKGDISAKKSKKGNHKLSINHVAGRSKAIAKNKKSKSKFVEDEASVASSDEEESDDEEAEIKNRENQYYSKDALTRKFDQAQRFKNIEEKAQNNKYEGTDEEGDLMDEEDD